MCYRAVKDGVYDRDTFHKLQGEEGLKLREGFRWLETYDLGYVKCGSCGSEDTAAIFYYGRRNICSECFNERKLPKKVPTKHQVSRAIPYLEKLKRGGI